MCTREVCCFLPISRQESANEYIEACARCRFTLLSTHNISTSLKQDAQLSQRDRAAGVR